MAHFNGLNQHRRRGHAVHRANPANPTSSSSSSSHTTGTTPGLIIPVAPTLVGNPFSTTSTSSVSSPPPVQSSSTTTSSVSSLLSTSSSLSTSLTSTTSTTLSTSSVISTPTTTPIPITHLSTPTSTQTFIQTVSNPSGFSSSISPSPTSSSTPSSGTSSGIIIGGVIAAILGAAGVLAAVVYFLRKCRGREDEAFTEEIWNRSDARRQSNIIGDEEPVRSYDAPPRPPTMIERHNRSFMPPQQPTMPNMYSNHPYGSGSGYGATNYAQNSFSPGQVVTPTSANPFFSPYAQDVMGSPVSSTVPEYQDPPRSDHPAFPPQALTREPSPSIAMDQAAVARQNSVTGGPFNPIVSSPDAADPQYTDLSRSSVTPFQAAQYAEITEKLGAPMTSVLGAVPEEPQSPASDKTMVSSHRDPSSTQAGNIHTESPFTDAVPVQQSVDDELDDDDLPLPSPNAFQQTRIPSLPPTLPEIHVPERSFSPVTSLDFPVPLSVHNSPSPLSVEFSDLRGPPPTMSSYKSSPLASSTFMPTEAAVIPREPRSEAAPIRPDTVYTVYDEEDAYGGM